MIPTGMKIWISKPNRKKVRLFIPLIIFWIFLFALLLLFMPVVFICALVFWRKGYGKLLLYAYPLLFSLTWELSGMNVQIGKEEKEVVIIFN
jgi:hypothetical protein